MLQGMISALNVLSTGETTAEDQELWNHFEPHEDINAEHQSVASNAGRAFYEVCESFLRSTPHSIEHSFSTSAILSTRS